MDRFFAEAEARRAQWFRVLAETDARRYAAQKARADVEEPIRKRIRAALSITRAMILQDMTVQTVPNGWIKTVTPGHARADIRLPGWRREIGKAIRLLFLKSRLPNASIGYITI